MMNVKLSEQFVGAMLGLMVGDALGRTRKDHTPESLMERENFDGEMIGGFYTEDSELAMGVAESLLELGEIDPDHLAVKFGQNLNAMRGHNPGELEVLYRLQQGMDWRDANRVVFAEGSYGVGGSCRATPIGLFYHNDHDTLIEAAAASARVTHAHPLGEAGAVTVALAVAMAANRVTAQGMFYEMQDMLAATPYAEILPHFVPLVDLLESWPNPAQVVEAIGDNRLTVQACIPAALYSVLRHPDSFEKAVLFAVSLGGDADTIGAIAGAVAGAYHGQKAIPGKWIQALENEERGRDYMIELGARLYETVKR
ncbi:MAG TPA: ADP-ribosylglycohydrolase family protein [Aggregatilineaceae bacterium]|nr:ADP-ribosylglycohydrolase family protein [Aggregatilineaceae bacterium]